MAENKETRDLAITDDLKPILSVLKEEDAQSIVKLKEELTDTWTKKQIFRTETEMRISVLNDGKHPTQASKYWQSEENKMQCLKLLWDCLLIFVRIMLSV